MCVFGIYAHRDLAHHFDVFAQDCDSSSTLAMELHAMDRIFALFVC